MLKQSLENLRKFLHSTKSFISKTASHIGKVLPFGERLDYHVRLSRCSPEEKALRETLNINKTPLSYVLADLEILKPKLKELKDINVEIPEQCSDPLDPSVLPSLCL